MFKMTGSLLQGDALLIKSTIGKVLISKTTDDIPPSIVVEYPKSSSHECLNDPSSKDMANEQMKLKCKDKPLEKELKNANNFDGMQKSDMAAKSDLKLSEREEVYFDKEQDDKTPTNEISISSMNDITDNSILKESMESEKHGLLFNDDIKNDLIMADEEKDDDNSERNKFVNVWVARLACKEKGMFTSLLNFNNLNKSKSIYYHMYILDLCWMLEEVTPEQQSITAAIIDFVITEVPCDIDILRRALYCQVN